MSTLRISALLGTILLAACTSTATPTEVAPSNGPATSSSPAEPVAVSDVASLTEALSHLGYGVSPGRAASGLPWREIAGTPRWIEARGEDLVVFQYQTADAFERIAARLKVTASGLPAKGGGIVIVEWGTPPHVYTADRLMALYFGDDHAFIRDLGRIMTPRDG